MADPTDTGALMNQLLTQALGGDKEALGHLLIIYRGYLRVLAQRELGGKLDARLDASDLIQQTCLSAVRNFQHFQGQGIPEFHVWLRQIHQRNLKDAIREHVFAAQRAVNRELQLEANAERQIAAQEPSPSGRAMASEEAAVLGCALDELPPDQREAVRLRHLEGLSLAEIADRLGRSEAAVAGLLKRGLQALRGKLLLANQGTK